MRRVFLAFAVLTGAAFCALPPHARATSQAGGGNGTAGQQPRQCITLEEAAQRAARFDPRLQGAAAQAEIAEAGLIAARARNLPTVTMFGQTGLGDTPPLDRRQDDQIGLQLNQELFSFGARAYANKAAAAQLRAARYGESQAQIDVLQGVVLAYLDYQRTASLVDLATREEEAFRQDAEAAASRLSRNIITLADASQIRSRYAVARSDTLNTRVAAEAARVRLAVLIDHEVDCVNQTSAPDILSVQADRVLRMGPHAAVSEALRRSVGVRQARAQIEAASATVAAAGRANLPVFSMNAFQLHQYVETADITGATTGEWENESRVGFAVNQNLFAGGALRAQRHDARARLKSAKADSDLEHLVVKDLVRRSLAQARAQQAAMTALLEAADQAEVRLQTTTREYGFGTKTLSDLVFATEDFYSAVEAETNARFQFYSSLVRLYGAMGMLPGMVGR